nr:immunoglobulin light chain junction region [Macaca mulatta]
CQNSITSPFIF